MHYKKLNYFLICLLYLFSAGTPLTALADGFTFAQAWQLLQQNNDGLAASKANKEEAIYLKDAAKDLYAPDINISGGYARLNEAIELSIPPLPGLPPLGPVPFTEQSVVTASLKAVWPIYTGGRITAAQDIADGQVLEANHLLRIKRQGLFEQLAKYYFGVVLAKQVLEARKHAEQGLFKHLDTAKKLEKQGQIARVERLKAEASFSQARVGSRKAQRQLEMAQMALNRLMQEKFSITPSNPLFVNPLMPTLSDMVAETLNNHPGLGVLDAKRLQAQGLVDVKEGEYWPEVFLFGNYFLYEQETLAAELVPDWVVGVCTNESIV